MTTLNIFEAEQLANDIKDMLKDCKGITAYALNKNLRLIVDELKEFEDIKANLFKQYGEELENGNMRIKEEYLKEYLEEMSKFNDEKVEVNLRTLKEEEIIESGLNGEQMFKLNKIIE